MNVQAPVANITSGVTNITSGVTNAMSNAKNSVSNMFGKFSQGTTAGIGASQQFLQSNTIVAKLGFLIFVVIMFLILLILGIMMLSYFTGPAKDPYIISGMVSGANPMTIPQDPNASNSIPVLKSNNQSYGLEFTWSFWLYIDNLPDKVTGLQTIFCKGDGTVNNGPGVYLGPDLSNGVLHIKMDTVVSNDANNTIDIKNIPLRNWVHITIRCEQTTIDAYVNGTIATRLTLSNLPKQNYNDVLIAPNTGFSGKISNLRYYSRALNIFEINAVVLSGPNTTLINTTKTSSGASYLSRNWYSIQQM
uniref:LamG-like jellyroll fold domain-containing protein n=1 Tax=viral metagenome TaxID=1070528 RepID=A0A6C0D3M3_9ZZZZ